MIFCRVAAALTAFAFAALLGVASASAVEAVNVRLDVPAIDLTDAVEFQHTDGDRVISRLVNDPCFNITAAGAIMRRYLTEAHGNLMAAIGYYHSHTAGLGASYQDKVIAAATAMFARQHRQP